MQFEDYLPQLRIASVGINYSGYIGYYDTLYSFSDVARLPQADYYLAIRVPMLFNYTFTKSKGFVINLDTNLATFYLSPAIISTKTNDMAKLINDVTLSVKSAISYIDCSYETQAMANLLRKSYETILSRDGLSWDTAILQPATERK